MWSFVKKSVLWWDQDIHLPNNDLGNPVNQTHLPSNSPNHIQAELKQAISINNADATKNNSENIRKRMMQLCNNISVAGYKKKSNDTVIINRNHNKQEKDDNDSDETSKLLSLHKENNNRSSHEVDTHPSCDKENRPSFWQRVKDDQAQAKQKVFRLVALAMYCNEMEQKRKAIIKNSQNESRDNVNDKNQNAKKLAKENDDSDTSDNNVKFSNDSVDVTTDNTGAEKVEKQSSSKTKPTCVTGPVYCDDKREPLPLDTLSLDALYAVHFTLWLREALKNPEHLLHKQMALKWLFDLRSITSNIVNPLLQITYEGRMTLVDTFRHGKNMSAFEQYHYGVLFNSVTGEPLMFVRDLYYAKGTLLEIHYFIYWWRNRKKPKSKVPFHYTIGLMFANDIMWCGMNTANITSDIIQIVHAAKHHIAYTDPMFTILGQSLALFSFFFDIGYAIDFLRDFLCNLTAYMNESDPIMKKRLGWAMLRNFLSNLGMLFARIVLSFKIVALALAPGCAIAFPALFLGAVGYTVWRLSKIKGKKAGWAIALGALSLLAIGLGIGLLMGTSLLAGGILFGIGAIGFGIATYKYFCKKGVDKVTSMRVAIMFGVWSILAIGVAAFVLFGAPFIAAVASAAILGVMLVGLFRELCKLVRVVETCVQKEQMLAMQNTLIETANKNANDDDGRKNFALSDNEEDWIDNMLLMEALITTHGNTLNNKSGLDSDQQKQLATDLRKECECYLSGNKSTAINNFNDGVKVSVQTPHYQECQMKCVNSKKVGP